MCRDERSATASSARAGMLDLQATAARRIHKRQPSTSREDVSAEATKSNLSRGTVGSRYNLTRNGAGTRLNSSNSDQHYPPDLGQGGPPIERKMLPPTLSRNVTLSSTDFSRKQVILDGVLIPDLSSQRINACHRYISIVPRLLANSSLPAAPKPAAIALTAC